jgi:hypothetical protein
LRLGQSNWTAIAFSRDFIVPSVRSLESIPQARSYA